MKHLKIGLLVFVVHTSISYVAVAEVSSTPEVPDSLISVAVDGYILDTVSTALPEQQQVGAEFLDPVYNPNMVFTADTQVSVTFISEGAGYKNTLGYFAYDANTFDNLTFGNIDLDSSGYISAKEIQSLDGVSDVGIIFGNASGAGGYAGTGGELETGDTFVIGDGVYTTEGDGWSITGGDVFSENTRMGFFVAANAWNGSSVNSWDNDYEVKTYWTEDFLNPENSVDATQDNSGDVSRHVAMLSIEGENQLLLGFEDLTRPGGDNDFNDAVFLIRTTPEDGFNQENLPSVNPAPAPGIGSIACIIFSGAVFAARRKRKRK